MSWYFKGYFLHFYDVDLALTIVSFGFFNLLLRLAHFYIFSRWQLPQVFAKEPTRSPAPKFQRNNIRKVSTIGGLNFT